jgi:glycosyltransferase involved in cell wall biosynthesis
MSDQPLVSIIIPTYNRAHLIGETLDSIVAQTYLNWECIIVDDGSSDNTDEVIGEYVQTDSRFKYYHRLEDYAKGANSCRHIGFLKSNGDYINWFDSDDLMLVNHIETKMKKMMSGDYDFVCCEVARMYNNKGCIKLVPIKNDYESNPVVGQFMGKLTLFTCGPLWHKEFLIKEKLYYKKNKNDIRDTVLNDWVFNLNALLKKPKYYIIKKVLIYYRSHDNSIYADRRKKNIIKIYDEFDIRKDMYENCWFHLGYSNSQMESFYIKKLLKVSRSLLYQKKKLPSGVYVELQKTKTLSFYVKLGLIIQLYFSSLTKKGIKLLRL